MADCRIVNAGVTAAVNEFYAISNEYKSAGDEFLSALRAAVSEMEGETKDALLVFFSDKVEPFVTEDLPNAVMGMRDMLEANRENFEKVDQEIAASIAG